MAAPRKYSDDVRETVIALVLDEGLTIAESVRQVAQGRGDLEPTNVSEKVAGDWVRLAEANGRQSLEDMELPAILDTTARGLFDLVNADIYRMKRQKGANDPEALLTLARTLKELQPLTSQARRTGKGTEKPATLLQGLKDTATTQHTTTQTDPVAARSLRTQSAAV